jgi:hypothetical protein
MSIPVWVVEYPAVPEIHIPPDPGQHVPLAYGNWSRIDEDFLSKFHFWGCAFVCLGLNTASPTQTARTNPFTLIGAVF